MPKSGNFSPAFLGSLSPAATNGLYLNMTKDCNLKCIYCFAATRKENGKERLNLSEYKNILNSVKNLCSDNMSIVFTGGEPLLSENTIPVAKYAKELGFSTKLLTNATLINETNVIISLRFRHGGDKITNLC